MAAQKKSRRIRWTFSGIEGASAIPPYRSSQPPATTREIGAEDLDVVFQPIVDLRSGAAYAYEALVRCKWPEFSNPIALFTQATQEKSCGRLGRAIRQVAFERCSARRVFVNVHPDELSSRWLVRPDDPLCLHDGEVFIEITESAAFTHYDLCIGVLKEVCSRVGAHLVVDDLGAAYSNLKRVIELEPRIVKLDCALVTGIDKNKRQQILVRSLVDMLGQLGCDVVAEGIETADELSALRDAGTVYGQGFLLGRPGFPLPEVTWSPDWSKTRRRRSIAPKS